MSSFLASLQAGWTALVDGVLNTDWPARLASLEFPDVSVDLLQSIALGIALAACAGLRAWLPMLAVGLSVRFGVLPLGDSFRFLGSTTALTVFVAATVIELVADKIPVVDHALDALSTFLKPLAGIVLAASVLWTVDDPLVALALGVMVGAPASLLPHTAKASVRGVLSPITMGLAAPVLSVLEDIVAVGLIALAILTPFVVAAGFLLFALVTGRFLRKRTAPKESPAVIA